MFTCLTSNQKICFQILILPRRVCFQCEAAILDHILKKTGKLNMTKNSILRYHLSSPFENHCTQAGLSNTGGTNQQSRGGQQFSFQIYSKMSAGFINYLQGNYQNFHQRIQFHFIAFIHFFYNHSQFYQLASICKQQLYRS